MKTILIIAIAAFTTMSCVVVRQGEVGVKRKLGKLSNKVEEPGSVAFNPLTSKVIKVPIQTQNLEIASSLPSKEGLNVQSVISILYRVKAEKVPDILESIGTNYEDAVISSIFRSASADVCSRFFAKDMHTAQRAVIEKEIQQRMMELLSDRGFEIEAVLLKTIQLPSGLARAVEEKLEAEQDAQRMEFLLQRERLEATRKMVEAEGVRDAQKIISEGLNPMIIQWQSIEAFRMLANSPGSKIIITDGKTPMLIDQ
jgi:prohibitin 1